MLKAKTFSNVLGAVDYIVKGVCGDDYHPLWAGPAAIETKAFVDAFNVALNEINAFLDDRPLSLAVFITDKPYPVAMKAISEEDAMDRVNLLRAYAELGTLPPMNWTPFTVGVTVRYAGYAISAVRETGDGNRHSYGLPSPYSVKGYGKITKSEVDAVKLSLRVIVGILAMAALLSRTMAGELDASVLRAANASLPHFCDSIKKLGDCATGDYDYREHPFLS